MSSLPADVDYALRTLLSVIRLSSTAHLPVAVGASDVHRKDVFMANVANFLYANWYCPVTIKENEDSPTMGRDDLTSALRAAVASSTRWQKGWVVIRTVPSGTCLAGRQNQTRELRVGEYANVSRPGSPVAPGDAIAAIECINWVDPESGWWYLQSPAGHVGDPLVRLYWNVAYDHAGIVLATLTSVLDSKQVRYLLKCPSRTTDYHRVDSLILYIEKSCWSELAGLIDEIAIQVGHSLRQESPPLTKKIAPGVGFAEDPETKESFGESRCRILASAVLSILQNPAISDEDALVPLVEALRTEGIDPVQPWLSPHRP